MKTIIILTKSYCATHTCYTLNNYVYVCVLACALLEGAGCLQQLRLFSIRDSQDGEDHPGQAELGSAQRHSPGLPAHRECALTGLRG